MIKNIYYTFAKGFVPYDNLAMEEYLLTMLPKDCAILYLWQNKQTVVIGKNQNPWQECKVDTIEEDGGYLARRLSGGGAVFHDLGNLNFTFLVNKDDYDVNRQLSVISKALKHFNLNAVKSGRNDLLIDDRKFSGNAFYKQKDNAYHHGTIMIDADFNVLSKYLNVSQKKLQSNAVSSVRSRVANLREFSDEITIESVKTQLVNAFSEVYGLESQPLPEWVVDKNELNKLIEKYASWDWRLGKKLQFDVEFEEHFLWGAINILLKINSGSIEEAKIYSDSMDCNFINDLTEALIGIRFSKDTLALAAKKSFTSREKVFEGFDAERLSRETMINDICHWLKNLDI